MKQKLKNQKRNVVACNIKQAKSVGLLFNSTIENDRKVAKEFEDFLRKSNIRVESIGYSHHKQNGDTLIGDSSHHYINIKDFNWYYKPKNEIIGKFSNSTYDVLINLYQSEEFEIEYILKTSCAKFKVGCAHLGKEMHDLMIDVRDKKGDTHYLCEQINHYLSILND